VASEAQLVVRGVTVVNPRDGSLRAGQDVRITSDQIAGVEPARDGGNADARGHAPAAGHPRHRT
jgi:adenine deaminase